MSYIYICIRKIYIGNNRIKNYDAVESRVVSISVFTPQPLEGYAGIVFYLWHPAGWEGSGK